MTSEWAAKLMSPDSIMEPGVTDAMKGYLEEGGEPETAIQMLADSYRGFAEMASLVGDWLHTAGVPHEEVVATVTRAVGDAVFQAFDPRLADSLFQKAAVCVVHCFFLHNAHVSRSLFDYDENSFIGSASMVGTDGTHPTMAPADLQTGRQVSFVHNAQLCNQGLCPCTMRTKTVCSLTLCSHVSQRISDQGHSMEIAKMSTMATMNFDVFNSILAEIVTSLLTCDEVTFHQQLSLFKTMCASNEHTFLYTQVFLYNLEQMGVEGARRLSQEVYVTATDAQHSMATSLAQQVRLLLLQERSPNSDQALSILRLMKAALASRNFTPSDIAEVCVKSPFSHSSQRIIITFSSSYKQLYREYRKPQPPPVQFLWDFEFLDLLLGNLFDVQASAATSPDSNQQYYLYLVAYASSYTGNPGTDEVACRQLMDALSSVIAVCPRSVSRTELKTGIDALVRNDFIRRYPIIAMGTILWARQNLLDPEFYASSNTDVLLPAHFLFLKNVVAYHPLQRSRVFELASAGFAVSLPSELLVMQQTLKRKIIDILVDLVVSGFVLPVLHQIETWGANKQLDCTHTRIFLGSLFQLIEPPYSPAFVDDFVQFLDHSWILEAFKDPTFRLSRGYQGVEAFLCLSFLSHSFIFCLFVSRCC